MAAEGGRLDAPLIEKLTAAPERFQLLQAVRILERAAARAADARGAGVRSKAVGGNADPQDEAVALRSGLELGYPGSEIASYDASGPRPALEVAVMGLTGASGVLPTYYSEMLLEQRRGRNFAMRDFLDVFNHRAISLFVRSSEKYRLEAGFERAGRGEVDSVAALLLALIGQGDPSLQGKMAVPDTTLAFYAGHYAHRPRNAEALGRILSDYFERIVRVIQFQGRWGRLPPHEQTSLKGGPDGGLYSQLGVDAVCGSQIYDVQGAFRIVVGPMSYGEFQAFLPGSRRMAELNALIRAYVGPALAFDTQLVLSAEEIPRLALSRDPSIGAQLGWNTWLPSSRGRADADDAVFEGED